MKNSAVHITVLALNFILFSKNLAVSWSFFQLPRHKRAHISAHIQENICCGYSFSKLEHKESFGTHFILIFGIFS